MISSEPTCPHRAPLTLRCSPSRSPSHPGTRAPYASPPRLENFVFLDDSEDAPLKLIDFGLSKLFRDQDGFRRLCSHVGTAYYTAPEILRGSYTNKCDAWSLGILLYMLLTGMCGSGWWRWRWWWWRVHRAREWRSSALRHSPGCRRPRRQGAVRRDRRADHAQGAQPATALPPGALAGRERGGARPGHAVAEQEPQGPTHRQAWGCGLGVAWWRLGQRAWATGAPVIVGFRTHRNLALHCALLHPTPPTPPHPSQSAKQ